MIPKMNDNPLEKLLLDIFFYFLFSLFELSIKKIGVVLLYCILYYHSLENPFKID